MLEWWQDFFRGIWEDVQLRQGTEDDHRASADRIERALKLAPGSSVLDVPCGDGRIGLELAARGHHVTGVDASAQFLAEAAQRALDRGLRLRLEEGDMRELPFDAEFDAVINSGGSFGFFDETGNARVAASASRALRPEGRFLIDTITTETILPNFRDRLWFEAGDLLVLAENRHDHVSGRIETEWSIVGGDGRRESRHSSMRLYSFVELDAMLRSAGFDRIEGFDRDGVEPFRHGASRLLLVGTKT